MIEFEICMEICSTKVLNLSSIEMLKELMIGMNEFSISSIPKDFGKFFL